jgi:hypothetical protein
MEITDVALAPLRTARLLLRAADDLHAVADRARREPDPVEEVRERLDTLLAEITQLTGLLRPLPTVVARLIAVAETVDNTGRDLTAGGLDLIAVGNSLDTHCLELIEGGQDLALVAGSVDRHSTALIDGGQDLTAVARELAATLRIFRAALPRMLDGLDTVEQLEDAVESVAERVEPLASAAEGVSRITDKLSRRTKDKTAQDNPASPSHLPPPPAGA